MKYSNIRDTNISKYMQILSDDDMVNVLLSPKKYTEASTNPNSDAESTLLSNIFEELKTQFNAHTQKLQDGSLSLEGLDTKVQNKLAAVYREMSIKVFQSLTVNTDFTHNILNYYYQETSRLLSIGDDKITTPTDIKKYTECIVFALSNSIKVVHANYKFGKSDNTEDRTLENSGFGIKRQTKISKNATDQDKGYTKRPPRFGGKDYPNAWKQKERFGQLAYEFDTSKKYYVLSDDLDSEKNPLEAQGDNGYKTAPGIYEINTIVDYKVKGEKSRQSDDFKVSDHLNLVDESGYIKVRNDSEDSNFASSLSYILLNNPSIRAGTKNSLELATFLNSLSTIELSKCLPFLEVKLMLPAEVETSSGKVFQTSSVTNFLNGTSRSSRFTTNTYKTINASFVRKPMPGEKAKQRKAIETNMAVFTMPQTANNFNETYTGHYESFHNGYKSKSERFSRNNIVQDITKPFLTVKSFNIDVAPTKGLMSFKSGRLSLILHDKSRMADIAPFIKPDLFGSFGAEIAIKYGWTHIDALNKESKDSKSAFGDFLQENRVYEKYIITNSSYSMDANGQVNIDLAIAMKGPIGIRAINFELDKPKQITSAALQAAIDREKKYRDTYVSDDRGIRIGGITSVITQVKNEFSKNTDANSNEKLEIISTLLECFKGDGKRIKPSIKADLAGIQHAKKVFGKMSEKGYLVFFKYDASGSSEKTAYIQEVDSTKLKNYNGKYASTDKTEDRKNLRTIATFYRRFYLVVITAKNNISAARGKQKKSLNNLIDKIMDGLILEDPFFDNLNFSYNDALENTRIDKKTAEMISKTLTDKDGDNFIVNSARGIDKKKTQQGKLNRFVTLGNILVAVLGTHLGFSSGFDEVQIISHTLNNHAGLAKNCNISSLLVDREELNDFLNGLFKNGGQYTLESLMTQIIRKFFVTRYCLNYGLRSLYKLDKNSNVVPRGNLKPDSFRKKADKKIEEIHRFFAKLDSLGEEDNIIPDVKFVMPKVKLLFDTVTNDETNGEATILRISIIDQNDNPFESITSFMNKFFEKDIDSVVRDINRRFIQLKSIKKSGQSNIAAERTKYLKENKRLMEKLIAKGFLKEDNGEFVLNTGTEFAFTGIKERVKAVMPSITYGTHNSAIIEASVSTINEARLNTVYITRPGRNEQPTAAKVRFQQELPLRVLPSQVNVSMFGCPFVNFAQMIFIDFETNTTVDNQYNVVGIKHDISPGKFTTSLTLAYGDAFGKFENIVDTINRTVVDVTSVKDAESKEEEKGKVRSTNEKPVLDTSSALEKNIDLSSETMQIISQDLSIVDAKKRVPSAFRRLQDPKLYDLKIIPTNIRHIVYDKDEIYYKIKKESIEDASGNKIDKLIFKDITVSQKKMSNQNFYIDIQKKFKIKESVENEGMLTEDQIKKLYSNDNFIFGSDNLALEQILKNTNIFSVLKIFNDIMLLKISIGVAEDTSSDQSRKALLKDFGILRYSNVIYDKDSAKDDDLIQKYQQRINLFNFKTRDDKESLKYSSSKWVYPKAPKSKKATPTATPTATATPAEGKKKSKKGKKYKEYTHTTLKFKKIVFTKDVKALDTDSKDLTSTAKQKLIKPKIVFEVYQVTKSRHPSSTKDGKKLKKDLVIEIDYKKLLKIFDPSK